MGQLTATDCPLKMNNITSHLWTNRTFQPTYEGFGSLRFGFHWAKFPIRILAEWDSCSLNNYYEIMTNFILLDAQDIQYWAVIDFAERERIRPLLCIGLLYCISNFRIVPAPEVAKPIGTDRIIVLSKLTIIEDLLHACGINRFKFNFCSWETFGSRIGATEISDAFGVLKTVGNIEFSTNDIERLDLTLITSSMEEVHVSLWGIKTALFEMNFASHRHKNVVVIITALSPRQRRGSMYLSSTRATTISFDLKYKALANLGQQVAEQYGEFICSVPLETHLGNLLNPAATPPTSTLGEILRTKLWVHQRYYCTVKIVNVVLHEQRQSSFCKSCDQHVLMDLDVYSCRLCGRNYVTQVRSMGIPVLVKDGDCTALLIIRGRHLKQLTGFHVNDFLRYYQNVGDNYRTHYFIRKLMGSSCTFELELLPASYTNTVGDLLIKQVLQYKQLRAHHRLP